MRPLGTDYLQYDSEIYPFRTIIEDYIGEELERIHYKRHYELLNQLKTEQRTIFHKRVYREVTDGDRLNFLELYKSFLKDYIQPQWGDTQLCYQTIPTFRFQFPGNIGVSKFHRDSSYNHSPNEKNYFLPLMDTKETTSIWVESNVDKGDYAPMICKYGEVIQWDGSTLTHGNTLNTTDTTRVSFDFRIISFDDWESYEWKESTITAVKSLSVLGDYWSKL